MKIKTTISRENLKARAYSKAKSRKIKENGNDEGNSALISQLIYNILLKGKQVK